MSLVSPTITVAATQAVVEYVDGAFTRVLGPGRHRVPRRRVLHRVVATQERLDGVAPQEVVTADGVTVRVTATIHWRVSDPRAFVERTEAPLAVPYLATQLALRESLLDVEVEALVRQARTVLGPSLTEAARNAGAPVGIEVLDVVVKDVILPHDLRSAYAELVTTRARGLARLEAARAETAALRSLANAARLLDEHPALARLRLVEALPAGSTVELTTD